MNTGVGSLGRWALVLLLMGTLSSCSTPPSRALVEAVLTGDEQRIARVAAEEALRTQLPPELQNLPELVQALETCSVPCGLRRNPRWRPSIAM